MDTVIVLGIQLGRPRIRFVPQLTASECSVACLAMVLAHLGLPVRRDELRAALVTDRDGASAYDLLEAASQFGLEGRGVRRDPANPRGLKPGSVLHWNARHFVVLEHIGRAHYRVVDPAVGRRRVDRAEFASSFGGLALEFSVSPAAPRRPSSERASSPSLALVRDGIRRPGVLVPMLLDAIVSSALAIGTACLIWALVERFLDERRIGTDLLIYTAGLVLLTAAVMALRERRVARLGAELERRLRGRLMNRLLRLPLDFYRHRSTAELSTRVGSVGALSEHLARSTHVVVTEGPLMLACIGVLFWWSNALAIAGVVSSAAYVATNVAFRTHQGFRRRQLESSERDVRRLEAQAVEQVATIRETGTESAVEASWRRRVHDAAGDVRRAAQLDARAAGVLEGMRAFMPLALLAVGGFEILRGTLSFPAMLGANYLAGALLRPLYALADVVEAAGPIRETLERIDDVLLEPVSPAVAGGVQRRATEAIVLEDVVLHGEGGARLDRVSLMIPPVRHIAIVGHPRSSASLLAAVIAGLERPDAGRVVIGGHEPADERSACVVRPSLELFDGCIRDNIALVAQGVTEDVAEDRVVAAARIAGVHEIIARLPLGYRTAVIDGGRNLDEETRRRILLARAVLLDRRLLVLDGGSEPLGATAERALIHAIVESTEQTVLTVSEHPSTVDRADFVVVLYDGRVVEARPSTGNHLVSSTEPQ